MKTCNKKILFLFTVNYPFSHGEHLLQYETEALLKEFDKVVIVCADTKSQQLYKVDKRIDIVRNSFGLTLANKGFSLLNIFSNYFWYEICIILFKYKERVSISKIYSILLAIKKGKKSEKFINEELKKYTKYDIYLYSWWTLTITNGFAFIKKKHPEITAMTRARAIDLYFERHKTDYIPLRKYLYETLDSIFCISKDGQNYISNKFNSERINNRVKVSRVGCINRNKYINTIENNIPQKIVTCSNIIPLKRLHLLIEALAFFKNEKIHWIHFGEGDLRDEIEDLSKNKLSKKGNITYDFKGYINNHDLFDFYLKNYVDLFINVSEYEGIPVTIMEAMSFGIPVIATDVGGVKEIVNESNGCLLPKEISPKILYNTVLMFLKVEDDAKQKYRENSRKTWEDHYNSDNNFKALAAIIKDTNNNL